MSPSGSGAEYLHLTIKDGVFRSNPFLRNLAIHLTTLSNITSGMFEGLSRLTDLDLDDNYIADIPVGAFRHLSSLESLILEYNRITFIRSGAFDGLGNLRLLALGGNDILTIQSEVFLPFIQLRFLFMTGVFLDEIQPDIFEGLEGLSEFHVDDFRMCCRVTNLGECVNYEPTRFATCSGGLLQYRVLSAFMWILGSSALFANVFVLVMRLRSRHGGREKQHVQAILIMNLAAADFLTGVYMIVLASVDAAFGSEYFLYAEDWRNGPWCKVVGIIAMLSSEASVLILSLISFDRLLGVVFPFSRFHFSVRSVKGAVAVIWIVAIAISIAPAIFLTRYPDHQNFYLVSDVCLGLPLIRSTTVEFVFQDYDYETMNVVSQRLFNPDNNYPFYAIAIFIGLNLLCFLVILLSYIAIFISAKRAARKTTRMTDKDRELRLAMRMALIIATDFCCWMPIIIMGILAQTGVFQIPTELYAWCVVIILPINSAVNPHLYTFGNLNCGQCVKEKMSSTSKQTKSTDVQSSDHSIS